MEQLTKISESTIEKYFEHLVQLGYVKDSEVNKILVLLFLEEVLYKEFAQFITEEDYKIITDTLYCLFGSNCMIDFPTYNVYDSLIHETKTYLIPRITEDSVLRVCQSGYIRSET